MDFATWATWTGIAHFPKVVVLVAVDDMVFRKMRFPIACCFVVAFESISLAALKHGGIEVFRIDFQHIHQKFPRPVDGFVLEIVAKRPVAKHLKHGVVVGVVAHFLQVVVLTAHAKALLAIGGSAPLWHLVAQNNILELVHAGIGEHQCRVVLHHHWSRWHNLVTFALKEGFERFSNFFCCQHIVFCIIYFF